MTLALAGWAIAPNPDGSITIGTATMPASHAADLATRILQACGDTSAAQLGRVRCREHLDAMFEGAGRVRVWITHSKDRGWVRSAIFDGRRCVVRIGDTTTAVLLRDEAFCRGFVCGWRDDALAGPVAELAMPMVRMSARWGAVKSLRGKA